MSDEQPMPLAPPAEALPAKPAKPTRSLINDLAEKAGIDPGNFLAAVKVAAGCPKATNEHFMVLLMQAQKYDLDPLSSPPQLQLLDVGNGPQVYARLDAYKTFLHRAEAAGKIEWRKYEEGWFPDPSQSPDKGILARGGKATIKLRHMPDPIVKIVWFREWGGKGQWQTRGSHMLEARAWKEACRDYLGFFLDDEEDARITQEQGGVREVKDATVSDAPVSPVVPIVGLKPPGATVFSPPPAPLDVTQPMPFEQDTMSHDAEGKPDRLPASSEAVFTAPPASPPLPDPNSEEGRKLAAELDAEAARDAAKPQGDLFRG